MQSAFAVLLNGCGAAPDGERRKARSSLWRNFTVLSCGMAAIGLAGCEGGPFGNHDAPEKTAHARPHSTPKSASSDTPVWGKPVPNDSAGSGPQHKPVDLVGLDENQVEAVLGPPTEQEDRSPAKTWRYRNGKCVVDLALYPDVETRVFRTLSYEVTTGKDTAAEEQLCLTELQARVHGK
jgi:hypothetical protein